APVGSRRTRVRRSGRWAWIQADEHGGSSRPVDGPPATLIVHWRLNRQLRGAHLALRKFMGGMSSQIVWKQVWSLDAESVLRQALVSQHCSVRELSSQQWDASTATIGGIRDYMTSYLAPASGSWSSLM